MIAVKNPTIDINSIFPVVENKVDINTDVTMYFDISTKYLPSSFVVSLSITNIGIIRLQT